MKFFRIARTALSLATIGLVTVASPTPSTAENVAGTYGNVEQADLAAARTPVAWELKNIFAGKTWIWPDGAAYFARQPRTFLAYAGNEPKISVAKGTWRILDNGILCTKSVWESQGIRTAVEECYAHRRLKDAVYQRKEPDGTWYVLIPSAEHSSDQTPALVAGDRVSSKYDTLSRSSE